MGANTSDMIKGLMDNAVRLERELAKKQVAAEARAKAEIKVLDLLKVCPLHFLPPLLLPYCSKMG